MSVFLAVNRLEQDAFGIGFRHLLHRQVPFSGREMSGWTAATLLAAVRRWPCAAVFASRMRPSSRRMK